MLCLFNGRSTWPINEQSEMRYLGGKVLITSLGSILFTALFLFRVSRNKLELFFFAVCLVHGSGVGVVALTWVSTSFLGGVIDVLLLNRTTK